MFCTNVTNMKTTIFISLLLVYSIVYSQDDNSYTISRSTISMGGSSKMISTNNTTYNISQSIGQSSVIGTSSGNGYTLRQGYQQPSIYTIKIQVSKDDLLKAAIYPNPFQQSIFISFSEHISNDIKVFLFDVSGSLIFSQEYPVYVIISFSAWFTRVAKINSGDII